MAGPCHRVASYKGRVMLDQIDVHGLSPYSGLHRALDTEALWTSLLVAPGQCLISRGDCGGLPAQRSEGTISLLCLGRWDGTEAGDVAVWRLLWVGGAQQWGEGTWLLHALTILGQLHACVSSSVCSYSRRGSGQSLGLPFPGSRMFGLLWAGLSNATVCPVGVSPLCSKCPASLIWASEQMTRKLRLRGAHVSGALGCVFAY